MELLTEIVPVSLEGHTTIWGAVDIHLKRLEASGSAILRWGIVNLTKQDALVEIASISGGSAAHRIPKMGFEESTSPKIHVALVIPTGVGATIGGFIGDAGPVAKTLETVADSVIVHPNVVNAADFYSGGSRTIYVDGFTLDRFFEGQLRLAPARHARIGLILDQLDSGIQSRVLNAVNGIRSASGIELVGYVVCGEKIRSRISRSEFGHYMGKVENPYALFHAAQVLQEQGANAIAVVTAVHGIPKEELNRHYMGVGPNPVGSIEALISRSITWKTGLPCAHAPAFVEGLGESSTLVDPRAASEVASGSSLPCLLYGLCQAPRVVENGGISVRDLSAVIVPFDCAGGPPARAAHQFGVPLLAVRANTCTVGVAADLLNVRTTLVLENYAEVIAFIACRKAGVSWESINRPLGLLKPAGLATPVGVG